MIPKCLHGIPKMAVFQLVTRLARRKWPNQPWPLFKNLTHRQKCVTIETITTNGQQISLFPFLHSQKKVSRRNGILHTYPPPQLKVPCGYKHQHPRNKINHTLKWHWLYRLPQEGVRNTDTEPECLGSNTGLATSRLCDLSGDIGTMVGMTLVDSGKALRTVSAHTKDSVKVLCVHVVGQQILPTQDMPLWHIILGWLFLSNSKRRRSSDKREVSLL